jgi:hypothetical protein
LSGAAAGEANADGVFQQRTEHEPAAADLEGDRVAMNPVGRLSAGGRG